MRIGDDIRKCVVFFGYAGVENRFTPIGTGFMLGYEGVGYLVTAKHLSHELGQDPFCIRVNKREGGSENLLLDYIEWTEHPDPTVDVSIVSVAIENIMDYDLYYLSAVPFIFDPEEFETLNIGVGNFTYTIGLFRLLSGQKRNLPICHFGTIAMLPGDERIPVIDWTDPSRKKRIFVEGYLVESQSLGGLSGSPVFVRPEATLALSPPLVFTPPPQEAKWFGTRRDTSEMTVARAHLRILGLWQGAWEAPPDEVLAAQSGVPLRVPVGMGVVVPWQKIVEVFELPKIKAEREEAIAAMRGPAAVPQSVARPVAEGIPASDANSNHREGFNSLLDAAVRRRPQGGRT